MARILIVDDEPRILLLLQSLLKANGYQVETARDGAAALEVIRKGGVDITVTDLRMAPMDGMTLFREIKAICPAMPVILLTAYATVETAVEAMKSGIFDYLTKPFKVEDMISCLKRAAEKLAGNSAAAGRVETPTKYRFENLIASSPVMMGVCDTIQKVAPTAATVLINGESGTGKEVIARTIHRNSTRASKPWVAVNCAAIPENLLESEMFGHVKGSFTGAIADKQGLFEAADGGTLFLDEISSMPLILQGKLLRVLQEREIRRVGGTKDIPVDVRVIAASNANLEEAVVKGQFRSDLYYRFYENSCQGPIAPAITAAHAEAVMSCFYPCSGAGPAHSTIRTRVCNLRRALQVPTVARTLPGRDIVRFRQERSSPRGCAL